MVAAYDRTPARYGDGAASDDGSAGDGNGAASDGTAHVVVATGQEYVSFLSV